MGRSCPPARTIWQPGMERDLMPISTRGEVTAYILLHGGDCDFHAAGDKIIELADQIKAEREAMAAW